MLNIATYVIDLEQDEEALWKNLGPKSRNAVRKAEKDGVSFVCGEDFYAVIDCFYSLYLPIAQQKKLDIPSVGNAKNDAGWGKFNLCFC